MRVSIVLFPGTNCEHDLEHVYRNLLNQHVSTIWHRDTDLKNPDLVVIPGGFSYGDYLRTGAMASISPLMQAIAAFAKNGGAVLGICNGFQILCEAGLLPGALLKNNSRKFISQFISVRVENAQTPFTRLFAVGDVFTCPVAHFEGNYFADEETLRKIEGEGQVVFRYSSPAGVVEQNSSQYNPNGSQGAIAGICNEQGNVVGLMPHPERAAELIVGQCGGKSGLRLFESSIQKQ